MSWLLGLLPESMKKYPKLVCLFLGSLVAYALYSNNTYAGKEYVDGQISTLRKEILSVQDDVSEFRKQAEIDTLLQRISDMDAEIYQLQRLDDNDEANDRDIDRLIMLRSSHAEATRQLVLKSQAQ